MISRIGGGHHLHPGRDPVRLDEADLDDLGTITTRTMRNDCRRPGLNTSGAGLASNAAGVLRRRTGQRPASHGQSDYGAVEVATLNGTTGDPIGAPRVRRRGDAVGVELTPTKHRGWSCSPSNTSSGDQR